MWEIYIVCRFLHKMVFVSKDLPLNLRVILFRIRNLWTTNDQLRRKRLQVWEWIKESETH